jgi:UDP-GlcNAc:undecaprenyl-phosphate GlcNAc-1-phosphate transferase
MPEYLSIPIAAVVAAVLAWFGTPLAIRAAKKTDFVDRPGGSLKHHAEATPYLGGMAIFVPFLTVAALVFPPDQAFLGVLLAATLAALLGLMDDFGAMKPGVKFVGQFVIVLVLLRTGVRIDIEVLPEGLNLALTAFWMLAIMNALNFLDIMDGLAATVALVAACSFLAIALLTKDPYMASISAVLVGTLVGYIRYSLPKASIFLGDSGSLFLGTVLGSLALALDYSAVDRWAVAAPILILAVPAFEITFTIGVRILKGLRPWMGSPDHVALRLRRFGLSVPQVLLVVASAGLVGGCLASWIVVGAMLPEGGGAAQDWEPAGASPWVVGLSALVGLAAAVALSRAPEPAKRAD